MLNYYEARFRGEHDKQSFSQMIFHAAALKTIVEFKDWFRSNGYNAVIKEFQLLGEQAIVFSITENLIAQYGISELSNEVINIYIDVLHLGGRL